MYLYSRWVQLFSMEEVLQVGVGKWVGQQALKGAGAAGRSIVKGAKNAAAPKVVKTTKDLAGADSVSSLEDVLGAVKVRKADKFYEEITKVVKQLEVDGITTWGVWLKKFAGRKNYVLDTSRSRQGTILKVACADEPTCMYVAYQMTWLIENDASAVTDVQVDGNQLRVILGALDF